MIGDLFGRLLPKAFISILLYFRGSKRFAAKRITICSIIVFAFVVWNSNNYITNIGKIENILQYTIKFKKK